MASTLTRLTVAGSVTALLAGCVIAPPGAYRDRSGAVDLLPLEPYVEVVPVLPGLVWIGGSWGWSVGHHHGWHGGHWRRR